MSFYVRPIVTPLHRSCSICVTRQRQFESSSLHRRNHHNSESTPDNLMRPMIFAWLIQPRPAQSLRSLSFFFSTLKRPRTLYTVSDLPTFPSFRNTPQGFSFYVSTLWFDSFHNNKLTLQWAHPCNWHSATCWCYSTTQLGFLPGTFSRDHACVLATSVALSLQLYWNQWANLHLTTTQELLFLSGVFP